MSIEEKIQSKLLQWANANSANLFLREHERSCRDLHRWFARIENACKACDILECHYAHGAIIFIESHDLAEVMREKQQKFLVGTARWSWENFKVEILKAIAEAEDDDEEESEKESEDEDEGRLSPDEIKQRLYNWTRTSFCYPLFKGRSEELGRWFLIVERACRESGIPPAQRTEAALLLIFGEIDLGPVMLARQEVYLRETGKKYWDWSDFKQDIREVVAEAERKDTLQFAVAAAGKALKVAGCAALLIPAGVFLLHVIGFTSAGVAAGSLAAMIQSVFYGGATCGIFSVLQMIGATAMGPALIALASGGSAMVVGSLVQTLARTRRIGPGPP